LGEAVKMVVLSGFWQKNGLSLLGVNMARFSRIGFSTSNCIDVNWTQEWKHQHLHDREQSNCIIAQIQNDLLGTY